MSCWKGYKQVGMKKKGNRMVPNCVPVSEEYDVVNEEDYQSFIPYLKELNEAEYQGRKVQLGKPMQGDAKGGTMKIRKNNPEARKSFRARHNCDNPGPRHKARYWSCRKW